jgi:hypothetical protein
MNFLALMAFATVLSLWILANMYIKTALKNLEKSRKYREKYMSLAIDLVDDLRFPESQAVNLLRLTSNSPGMINAKIFLNIISGRKMDLELSGMDSEQARKYKKAIRSLVLSSSYRSVIIGPFIRRACLS